MAIDESKSIVAAYFLAAQRGGINFSLMADLINVSRQMIAEYRDFNVIPNEERLVEMVKMTKKINQAIKQNKLPITKREAILNILL